MTNITTSPRRLQKPAAALLCALLAGTSQAWAAGKSTAAGGQNAPQHSLAPGVHRLPPAAPTTLGQTTDPNLKTPPDVPQQPILSDQGKPAAGLILPRVEIPAAGQLPADPRAASKGHAAPGQTQSAPRPVDSEKAPVGSESAGALRSALGSKGEAGREAELNHLYTGEAPQTPAEPVEAPKTPQSPAKGDAHIEKTLPDGQVLKIKIKGEENADPRDQVEETNFAPPQVYDAVIVGGGLAGLSAAWHLRDKNILILESAHSPGGLAAQGETRKTGITYARGAAYYTEPEGDVAKIYDEIGLTPVNQTAIPEPIDSFYHRGEIIKGIWEEEALNKLPPGFRAFKEDLARLVEGGYLDFNPPEPVPEKSHYLDRMTAEEFLRPYGPELTALLDSYTQSALGGHVDQISALPFLLFYMDEVTTRYTWEGGTGGAAQILSRKLYDLNHSIFRTRASVEEVVNTPDGVKITYERDGKQYEVRAKHAVVATPLVVTAKIVPQMPESQRDVIEKIKYADYVILNFFTHMDYWKETYDMWVQAALGFSDFIAARWVETKGFKTEPNDPTKPNGPGIITVYVPLAPPHAVDILSPEGIAKLAAKAAMGLRAFIPEIAHEKSLVIEAFRWPKSIHQLTPGFLSLLASALTAAVGNIQLANNNQGTPAFETALLEGRRAGLAIRAKLEPAPPPPTPTN